MNSTPWPLLILFQFLFTTHYKASLTLAGTTSLAVFCDLGRYSAIQMLLLLYSIIISTEKHSVLTSHLRTGSLWHTVELTLPPRWLSPVWLTLSHFAASAPHASETDTAHPAHTHTHTHTHPPHTHTHTHWPTTILQHFVRDNPGEPVPEETFTRSHLSWSSIILYQLPPSTMMHSILPVQFMLNSLQQIPSVFNRMCKPKQIYLYNGHEIMCMQCVITSPPGWAQSIAISTSVVCLTA